MATITQNIATIAPTRLVWDGFKLPTQASLQSIPVNERLTFAATQLNIPNSPINPEVAARLLFFCNIFALCLVPSITPELKTRIAMQTNIEIPANSAAVLNNTDSPFCVNIIMNGATKPVVATTITKVLKRLKSLIELLDCTTQA